MPMSAAGSEALNLCCASRQRGFTLIELMVVITLIAIATAGVSFAIRDSQSSLLDREADRLSTLLETARVQSRSSGVAIAWLAVPEGFVLMPAQSIQRGGALQINASMLSPWLAPDMNAQILDAASRSPLPMLVLGAEPMITPATVVLSLGQRSLRVSTDGLRPFTVSSVDEAAKP